MTHPPISETITFVSTSDLDAASAFLGDTLDLDLVVDQGACRIYRLTPTSFLGVCSLPGRPHETSGVIVTIVTDDVDGWYRFLADKGVAFDIEPSHNDQFGIYQTLLTTADGYRIEFQTFDDPHWADR